MVLQRYHNNNTRDGRRTDSIRQSLEEELNKPQVTTVRRSCIQGVSNTLEYNGFHIDLIKNAFKLYVTNTNNFSKTNSIRVFV